MDQYRPNRMGFPLDRYISDDAWIARLAQLQDALAACPTDLLSRCELAAILERLEQHEEALFNWKAVLACDPNSLKAREGVARCLQRTGRRLQSGR
ncbi:MAG: hypothetical protein AAB433_15505 [Nitrospirota bacterium]|mgnify:CR=1 FL=1